MVKCLHLKGAPVSSSVIIVVTRGMILANDSSLFTENGGFIELSKNWANHVLYKLIKRMATTSQIPLSPAFLSEARLEYQRRYKSIQLWHKIPKDLISNFDQTPFSYACVSKHTLEKQGKSSVLLVGQGKKKQKIGALAMSQSGDFLPMQLIYQGKTLPSTNQFCMSFIT